MILCRRIENQLLTLIYYDRKKSLSFTSNFFKSRLYMQCNCMRPSNITSAVNIITEQIYVPFFIILESSSNSIGREFQRARTCVYRVRNICVCCNTTNKVEFIQSTYYYYRCYIWSKAGVITVTSKKIKMDHLLLDCLKNLNVIIHLQSHSQITFAVPLFFR